MRGQMYVSYKVPARVTSPHPIVVIHGGSLSGANFEGTPDGREGWADFFVARGYTVYVVDQPNRGRSGVVDNPERFTVSQIEHGLTSSFPNDWPQASPHTQWPGTGLAGDPTFDQFVASRLPFRRGADVALWNQTAGAALLDRIGPAILLTHSQAGEFGWLIADARPELVKAIVAVEPSGPPRYPFDPRAISGGPGDGLTFPWGIASVPITYTPSVSDPSELRFVEQGERERAVLPTAWLQKEPARLLPNLMNIPVLVVTADASYHRAYDRYTVNYLRQAGVRVSEVRLENYGIRGNGHMMMFELNNLEIGQVIVDLVRSALDSNAESDGRPTRLGQVARTPGASARVTDPEGVMATAKPTQRVEKDSD
jgi:pimeloyl-ACP methyl ester carboxylesterase